MSRQIEEELLLFNFRSYGRGRCRRDQPHLTPAQAQLVARTAARTPEVMVKVLSCGAGSGKASGASSASISIRRGAFLGAGAVALPSKAGAAGARLWP